jgi:hypothetical protein
MRQMDFQSFQAMGSDGNVDDVRAMTQTLGTYGRVMLAHYKPNNGSAATVTSDLTTMFTDSFMSEVAGYGLFAWSFMDQATFDDPSESVNYDLIVNAVRRY